MRWNPNSDPYASEYILSEDIGGEGELLVKYRYYYCEISPEARADTVDRLEMRYTKRNRSKRKLASIVLLFLLHALWLLMFLGFGSLLSLEKNQ